jgi:hypothetical protein
MNVKTKVKYRSLLRTVFVSALALLSLVSVPVLVAGTGADGVEAHASGAHEPGDAVSTEVTTGQCVTIRRGTFGEVEDVFIWSANPWASYNRSSLYTGVLGSGEKRSLIRFGLDFLPDGAVIQSATFGIWQEWGGSGETIGIYRITEPWSEGEPTWDNFAGNYDGAVEWGSFVAPGGPGFLSTADVTGLVLAWADGAVDNYGLMLVNSLGQGPDQYMSSEFSEVAKRPWLEVCYAVNRDPVAVNDDVTTDEDTPVEIAVLDNDSDPDGDALTVVAVGTPASGSATTDSTVVTYTPAPDFDGSDTFTYTVSDGDLADTATVAVTVTSINDPPIAVDDAATTAEGTAVTVAVLGNDSDPDGDTLAVVAVGRPASGSATTDGTAVTYTPAPDFDGSDTFTYTVSDGDLADTATVAVTVTPINNPPIAVDDVATTAEDTPRTIAVLGNDSDPDGDTLAVVAVGTPTSGSATTDGTAVTYTPAPDFDGGDAFTYTVSDGNGGSDTATVTVIVSPVNDDPLAVDDSATTDEDTSVIINVLVNDSDPDGDTLTVSSVTQPGHGAVTNGTTHVTYTPNPNFLGDDAFTYTVSDGHGSTDTATVSVTVVAPGPAPSPYRVYLPFVVGYQPDLVVEQVVATGNDVRVVIKNAGHAPVDPTEAFRVDLYINPDPIPSGVNQTWDDGRCTRGIVWIVTDPALPLLSDGTITLTVGDVYYRPSLSSFSGSFPVGTTVYAQVDSVKRGTVYGAVMEDHEAIPYTTYNNIGGPVLSAPGTGLFP